MCTSTMRKNHEVCLQYAINDQSDNSRMFDLQHNIEVENSLLDSVHPTDSASTSSSSSSSTTTKSVQFENVEIREYSITIGDNPSVSEGPPISLGWYYDERDTIELPLEEYEQHRACHRREKYELRIPSYVRLAMLRERSISTKEILSNQRECEDIKKQRYETLRKEQRREKIKYLARRLKKVVVPNSSRI